MTYTVYVRRLAELDAEEAQAWYEERRVGLGKDFNDELGKAFQQLEYMPLTGQKIYGQIRRTVLHRFPYLLWYQIEGERVTVLACTHGKRGSKFIRSRLR